MYYMDSQIRFGVESTLLTLDYAGFLENIQGSCLFLLLNSPVLLWFFLQSRLSYDILRPPLPPDNQEPLPHIHRSASETIATATPICPQPEGFLCSVSHSSILLGTGLQNLTVGYLCP